MCGRCCRGVAALTSSKRTLCILAASCSSAALCMQPSERYRARKLESKRLRTTTTTAQHRICCISAQRIASSKKGVEENEKGRQETKRRPRSSLRAHAAQGFFQDEIWSALSANRAGLHPNIYTRKKTGTPSQHVQQRCRRAQPSNRIGWDSIPTTPISEKLADVAIVQTCPCAECVHVQSGLDEDHGEEE